MFLALADIVQVRAVDYSELRSWIHACWKSACSQHVVTRPVQEFECHAPRSEISCRSNALTQCTSRSARSAPLFLLPDLPDIVSTMIACLSLAVLVVRPEVAGLPCLGGTRSLRLGRVASCIAQLVKPRHRSGVRRRIHDIVYRQSWSCRRRDGRGF